MENERSGKHDMPPADDSSAAPPAQSVARFAPLILFVCAAILFADEIYYVNNTYDDAFIFFRYAENLARGKGWVFSAGERVEAYTSFLWAALLGLAALLGAAKTKIGLVIVAKVAGVLLSLCTVVCVGAAAPLVSPRTRNPLRGSIAVIYLCLSAPFAMWTVGGLETPLAALLAVAAVYFYIRDRMLPLRSSTWPRSAALFALAVLTRPEMIVLFAVTAAFDWARVLWTGSLRSHFRSNLIWCATFVAPCGVHLLWRRFYYGQWLPNTYYAKVYGDGLTWERGQTYISSALVDLGLGIVLAAAVVPFVLARRLSVQVAYLLALTLSYILAIALEGGDWMPAFRFVIPLLPLLGLLFDAGVSEAYDQCPGGAGRWLVGTTALGLVGATTYLARRTIPSSPTPAGFQAWAPVPVEHEQVARWISDHLPNTGLLALGEAGVIPYYTEFPVLDLLGLADRHIAHLFGTRHNKFDVDYVLARRPSYVLFYGKDPRTNLATVFTYSARLLKGARFVRGYRVCHDFRAFTLYVRADVPSSCVQ